MTLVSAPAGFGKTTCISEWVTRLDIPVTWLSLDPADDEPGRFFSYLIAALQKIDGHFGREIEGILRSGQAPPVDVISATLINDILDWDSRFLLVLDDFQVIQDRPILKIIENLVTNLLQPNLKQPLHLVLITREDPSLPLARLRANNQLTEIRVDHLRFTGREVDDFLNQLMDLSLSQTDIAALEDRTEGWIAGLQLAAIAMKSTADKKSSIAPHAFPSRDRSDRSSFIANLSGSHRFILSYLTEEVLNRQPAEIQDFLLQTSILTRMSGELCNTVTGRTDSQIILEKLVNANLFLIPLDDEQHWYRYHHLFASLLRDRQKANQSEKTILILHQRASRWFAQASETWLPSEEKTRFDERITFAGEAIQHALTAADYETAVQLIENYAMEMVMQWYAKTVKEWMQAIPPEWGARSTRASLAFAWMHLMQGDFTQASPYLERLHDMFSNPHEVNEPSFKAEWLALQAMLANVQAKPQEGRELAVQALEIAPEKDINARSHIYMELAMSDKLLDDYPRAVDAYQKLIQLGRDAGNIVSELTGLSGLALLVIEHGQLNAGFEYASRAAERMERSGILPPICAGVYGELGQIYYHWHQLDQAEDYFQRAARVSALVGFSDAEIYHAVIRSRLFQMQGDLDGAAREIQKAVNRMRSEAPAVVREEVVHQQVRVCLAQNQLSAAETALSGETGFSALHGSQVIGSQVIGSQVNGSLVNLSIPALKPGQNIPYPLAMLYNSALRILIYRAQVKCETTSLQQGIELADRLLAAVLQRQYIPIALETLLLRGQIHAALGELQASLDDYRSALALAEPEGYISIFVEQGPHIAEVLTSWIEHRQTLPVQPGFVKKILAAFPGIHRQEPAGERQPAPIQPPESATGLFYEPLSDRELDVLRLIAEGKKYQEISESLYISLNTVRTHVKSIYGKLNVNNRTHAIEVAHQLRIL